MPHDFESREWAQHHAQFGQNIGAIVAYVMDAFEELVAIEYDAPWKRENGAREGTCS